MTIRFYPFIVAALTVSLSACSYIPGTQSYENKNNPEAELKPLKKIKTTLNVKKVWQVNTNNKSDALIRPYLDNKSIFVAGSRAVSAWHSQNGTSLWKTTIGEPISAGVNGTLLSNPQARETTKKFADQVFIGTTTGNAIALDAKSGKIQWIERLTSEVLSVSSSESGRVTFRTVDGKIHGLDTSTGELIWQKTQKTPSLTQLGASSPVVVANLVIAGFGNGKIAAYDLQNGNNLWEISLSGLSNNQNQDNIMDVDGRLKVLGNALFANSINGNMIGMNLETGQRAWSRAFSSPEGIDANSFGLFTTDSDGKVWAFNPQTGDPAWSLDDLEDRYPSTPMIVKNDVLVVTDIKGEVHFIKALEGKFLARQQGDKEGYSVAPTVSGNSVYLFGKSGLLSKLSL